MNIEIRESTKEDINNGLLDVFIEGYRYHQKGRPDVFENLKEEELKEDLLNNLERFKTLILLEDNKVVGYLSYDIKERRKKKMHVDQLVIKETSRHKGYGKALMDKVKEIAKEENCTRIELDCWTFNENALSMYEHIGFKRQRILYEMDIKEQ